MCTQTIYQFRILVGVKFIFRLFDIKVGQPKKKKKDGTYPSIPSYICTYCMRLLTEKKKKNSPF